MSEILQNPNTDWNDTENCTANDLGYLQSDISDVLCDESGNRLLAHTGEKTCKTGQKWNNIL